MDILKSIIVIVVIFVATPFTMALAKLSGLSEFSQSIIAIIGISIGFAIAWIRTEKY